MNYSFTTTADDDAALAALGTTFEDAVRSHLKVLVSNVVDARFEKIRADINAKDEASKFDALAKLEAEAKK